MSPGRKHPGPSFWWFWFPISLFSLLSILLTWPLAVNLGQQIPVGLGGDAWGHLWTFHWIKFAWTNGLDPYHTKLLFYPDGASLLFHNIAWFNIGLWLPLQSLFGEISAYSLTYLLIFCLNGCALYWLLYDWTRSPFTATVAGLVHLSWPHLMSQTGHPNTITVMWIPLAILFLRRALAKRHLVDILLVGCFLALTGISRWQLLFMGGIGFGIYYLYAVGKFTQRPIGQTIWQSVWSRYWRTAWITAGIGVVAFLLMTPLGKPVADALMGLEDTSELVIQESLDGSDLLAYLVPNLNSLVGHFFVEELPFRLRFTRDRVDFIGLVTLALAIVGIWRRWSQVWIWVLIGGVYLALCIGPDLTWARVKYPQVPVPYRLVSDLFFIKMIRDPHRFNIFLALPIAVLAGYGADVVRKQWAGRSKSVLRQGMVGGIILLAILLEHWIYPYRLAPIQIPEWYKTHSICHSPFRSESILAGEGMPSGCGPGSKSSLVAAETVSDPASDPTSDPMSHVPSLLSLPISHDEADKEYMRYQLIHGMPLAQGHISRAKADSFRFLDSTPFLAHLHATNQMDPNIGDVTYQLEQLAQANIRYLILHKNLASVEQIRDWRHWLIVAPEYEDNELIVYNTRPMEGFNYSIEQVLTEEIGLLAIETNLGEMDARYPQGGTIQIRPTWGTRAVPKTDFNVCLYLIPTEQTTDEIDRSAPYCQTLGGERPTSLWNEYEVMRQPLDIQLSPFHYGGKYQLLLGLERENASVGQQIELGEIEVVALGRMFDAPQVTTEAIAIWNKEIQLLGYDLSVPDDFSSGSTLELLLHWQALTRMERSYKFFVHMVNGDGERVAQYDGIPRGWSYPTTYWEVGEYVDDNASFTIEADPDGTYSLIVGIYDEATGQRLEGLSADGASLPDNALLLGTIP